jgi:benzodiazapine receptor
MAEEDSMTTANRTAPVPTRRSLGLMAWLAACVGGGALVGAVTAGGESAWYASLDKPPWTPPGWVFAPVWTALYAAMGVAAWLVWRRGSWRAQATPLAAFLVQLALNFAWSLIFFGLQRPGWALADIAALWVLIAVTIRLFARVDRRAAWLLAPYLAWVTFAMALNGSIHFRN